MRRIYIVSFLLMLVVFLLSAWLFVVAGSDSYSMVWAFDCDEAGVLEDLIKMFRNRSYLPLNYIYGTLHEYLALTALLILSAFRRVTEQDGVIILRLISTIAAAGIFHIIFRSAVMVLHPAAGLIAIAMLLSSKVFTQYSFNGKPELIQAALLMVSLYFLNRAAVSGWRRWYLFAGISAGLAFTAKFAGIMVLPLSLIVPFIALNRSPLMIRERITASLQAGAIMGGGFATAIALTSPYMVRDAMVIVRRLAKASEVNREGFLFAAGSNFTEWLQILFGSSLLGIAGIIGLALLVGLFTLRKKESLFSAEERALLWIHGAWCLLFCLYLFTSVNFRPERFILPAVPSFALIAGYAIARFAGMLRSPAVRACAAAILLAAVAPNILKTTDMLDARLRYRETSRVKAGIWLQENVPAAAVIASDYLTYVPATFTRQLRTSLLTSRDVMLANPDSLSSARSRPHGSRISARQRSLPKGRGSTCFITCSTTAWKPGNSRDTSVSGSLTR